MTDGTGGVREDEGQVHERGHERECCEETGCTNLEQQAQEQPCDTEEAQGEEIDFSRYRAKPHDPPGVLITPGIPSDLCYGSYEDAQTEYLKRWGVYAQALLVSLDMAQAAYQIALADRGRVIVIPVPGMFRDTWLLVGSQGVYFNQGA